MNQVLNGSRLTRFVASVLIVANVAGYAYGVFLGWWPMVGWSAFGAATAHAYLRLTEVSS